MHVNVVFNNESKVENGYPTNYLDNRFGCWANVTEVSSKNCTVSVILDTGTVLTGVPVASQEWVSVMKEPTSYVSGERSLPPIGSRVFILMPTGKTESSFVLCSGFTVGESAHVSAFMDSENQSEKRDKDTIRETVLPGNWKKKYFYENGSCEIVSPDKKTSFNMNCRRDDSDKKNNQVNLKIFDELKIDHIQANPDSDIKNSKVAVNLFDELKIDHTKGDANGDIKNSKVNVNLFDELNIEHIKGDSESDVKDSKIDINVFDELKINHVKGDSITIKAFEDEMILEHKKGVEVKLEIFGTKFIVKAKTGNLEISTLGTIDIISKGNLNIDATGNCTINSTKGTEIKGSTVKLGGTVDPTGSGALCGIPVCLFTGAPHVGDTSAGA